MAATEVQYLLTLSEEIQNVTQNGSANQTISGYTSSHEQEDFTHAPMYLFVCVTVFNILAFIVGTFGNMMVILVVCRVRAMRNPTNYFLFSLSVADLFVLLVCQPTAMMEFYAKDRWYLGGFMCRLVPLLENGMLHVSILTIIAVTTERYMAICYPLKKHVYCSDSTAVKVIVIVWFSGYACTSPFLFMTSLEKAYFYDGSLVDVCTTKVQEIWQKAFVVACFIVFFALPFFVLLFMYILIIRQLMSDSIRILNKSDRCARYAHRSRKQVVRMLIVTIILFFTTLCPIRVVSLWQIFTYVENVEKLGLEGYLSLLSFARIMMYLNSSMNPVIYTLTSSKFKSAFKRVLRRSYPQGSVIKQENRPASDSSSQQGPENLDRRRRKDVTANRFGCYISCEKSSSSSQHTHSV